MVSEFGWLSIFFLNLPIGIIGILMTRRHIDPTEARTVKLAVPGHILLIVALAALSYALSEGPWLGWGADAVLTALIEEDALREQVVVVLVPLREGRHRVAWVEFLEDRLAPRVAPQAAVRLRRTVAASAAATRATAPAVARPARSPLRVAARSAVPPPARALVRPAAMALRPATPMAATYCGSWDRPPTTPGRPR